VTYKDCAGDLALGNAGTITNGGVLYDTKGDYPLPAVPTFNVTGQSEGSVRRELKIVDPGNAAIEHLMLTTLVWAVHLDSQKKQ
jgi:hypothetical protein